jgi:hypothetical protein
MSLEIGYLDRLTDDEADGEGVLPTHAAIVGRTRPPLPPDLVDTATVATRHWLRLLLQETGINIENQRRLEF